MEMTNKPVLQDLQQDILDIAEIPAIPAMLNIVCQITGMGFSAVARVTEDRWVTCSAHDDLGFGLKPGDELQVKTTICDEIRQTLKPVVIDNVSLDPHFCNHHTPEMYGLQSYISMPIIRRDGSFFGTLCAIDPNPHHVSSETVTGTFRLFAELISFHLDAIESGRTAESKLLQEKAFNEVLEKQVGERTHELNAKNAELEKMNKELQAFAYISSHDLQEPLRKIQTISALIEERESHNLSNSGKDYFRRMRSAAERMQSLINDLLAYSRTSLSERRFEHADLGLTVKKVIADFSEDLEEVGATMEVGAMCHARIIPFQMHQLFHNLISNSLKFAMDGRPVIIKISSIIADAGMLGNRELQPQIRYCHIKIEDNGIGFDQKYEDKIFEVFRRLHDRSLYQGTGIGLAIVKKIVENHDGYITATGTLGQGTVFDIYIPVDQT